MTELIGILKAHEARLSSRDEGNNEGAFNARTRKDFGSRRNDTEYREKEGKTWCVFCKRSNHTEDECWRKSKGNNQGKSDKSNIKCYNCGEMGHYSDKCRSKKKERAHVIVEEEDSSDEDHMLFNASEVEATIIREDVWLVDSGCTNHMTREEKYFTRLDRSINVPIKVGNGEIVMTAGKGDITVCTNKGEKVIRNVFLVPGLEKNLLSVPQIISSGYSVVFENKCCKILDSMRRKIMDIQMVNKSFPITWNSLQDSVLVTGEEGVKRDSRRRSLNDMVIKGRHQEKKEAANLREEGSKRRIQMITEEEVKKIHARDKRQPD